MQEVTPQLLNDVEFRERKFGGYDPDEVDDFIARIGVAIGQWQQRVKEAEERVSAAESRAAAAEAKAAATVDTDDTLRRTLVLAQKTADAAIAEAKEEATRTIAAAREEADRQVSEAREQSARLVSEADLDAKRRAEEARDRLKREVDAVESTRDKLLEDVALLERHLDLQRSRLREGVAELTRILDDPSALKTDPAPRLAAAETPVVDITVPGSPEGAAPSSPPHAAAPVAGAAPTPTVATDEPAAPPPPPPPPEPPSSRASSFLAEPAIALPLADAPPIATAPAPPAPEPLPLRRPTGWDDDTGGPPTAAVSAVGPEVTGESPLLDELRRVVTDDAATGDEEAMTAFFDQDPDDRDRNRRFGRRR